MGRRRPRVPGPAGIRTLWLYVRVRLLPRDSGPLRDARRPAPADRRRPCFGATHASPESCSTKTGGAPRLAQMSGAWFAAGIPAALTRFRVCPI
jgi:hypothetical protein